MMPFPNTPKPKYSYTHIYIIYSLFHPLDKDGIDLVALYVHFVFRAFNFVRHGEIISSRLVAHIGKRISFHCPHARSAIRHFKCNQVIF